MNLDEKLREICSYTSGPWGCDDVDGWIWKGEPRSEKDFGSWVTMNEFHQCIDKAIREGSLVECLTHPSEYVRECKKYMESKDEKARGAT